MNKDPKRRPIQRSSERKYDSSVPQAPPVVKPVTVLPKFRRQDIFKCSACGQEHTRVLFRLREGVERKEYQYAAKCPISGKEILLKVDS